MDFHGFEEISSDKMLFNYYVHKNKIRFNEAVLHSKVYSRNFKFGIHVNANYFWSEKQFLV